MFILIFCNVWGFGDELPEQDEILQEFDDNGVESDFIAELEYAISILHPMSHVVLLLED